MISGLHLEVALALAYTFFLAGVAALLEAVARRSQKRAEGYQNSGFIHFRELDYWQCPMGHRLLPLTAGPHHGTRFYRASASACNSCSLKHNCTDSDDGRVLTSRFDNWIDSELRRFHRAISFALLLLALVLLTAEAFRYSALRDRAALVLVLIPLGFVLLHLWPSLIPRHRANQTFPFVEFSPSFSRGEEVHPSTHRGVTIPGTTKCKDGRLPPAKLSSI